MPAPNIVPVELPAWSSTKPVLRMLMAEDGFVPWKRKASPSPRRWVRQDAGWEVFTEKASSRPSRAARARWNRRKSTACSLRKACTSSRRKGISSPSGASSSGCRSRVRTRLKVESSICCRASRSPASQRSTLQESGSASPGSSATSALAKLSVDRGTSRLSPSKRKSSCCARFCPHSPMLQREHTMKLQPSLSTMKSQSRIVHCARLFSKRPRQRKTLRW
mmetsp:Transcript_60344/g.194329  ORF Transcript_60344/g.194329 Transcript_60344/m.194329 type:complete len:221 (+) Transcript_60344:598-1260(+)